MSESPSGPGSWAARLRRLPSRARPAHLVAAAAVAGVFGVAGLAASPLPGPRALSDSERLRIEVVAPVEPEIVAGSVMEVGDLVEGFQGLPPAPAPVVETVAWVPDDDDWDDWRGEAEPPPSRRLEEPVVHVPAPPGPPRSHPARDRRFGFDAPRRDYRAEREARRARIERERERDKPRRYWSDPDRPHDPERRPDRDLRNEDDRWRDPPPPDGRPPPDRRD